MDIKFNSYRLEEEEDKTELKKVKSTTTINPKSKTSELELEDKDFFLIKAIQDLTESINKLTARLCK